MGSLIMKKFSLFAIILIIWGLIVIGVIHNTVSACGNHLINYTEQGVQYHILTGNCL